MQTQFVWKFFWSVTSKSFKKHLFERVFRSVALKSFKKHLFERFSRSVALKSFKKHLFERFFQVLGSSSNFWTASADLGGPTAPHQSRWHRNHRKTFIWKVFRVCGIEIIQKTFIWKVFPGCWVPQQLLDSRGRPGRYDRPKVAGGPQNLEIPFKKMFFEGFQNENLEIPFK